MDVVIGQCLNVKEGTRVLKVIQIG